MDSNMPHHDKTLRALGYRGGKSAMFVATSAICWSVGQGTDGHIPAYALPSVHGTKADAGILVEVGLWDPDPDGDGWWIHNFDRRQETSEASEARRIKARKAADARWKKVP